MMNGISITGYKPGSLADVLRLHMAYYHAHWGFGLGFETKVASELSEFMTRFDPDNDLFLIAQTPEDGCIGSISIDCQNASGKGVHVRWFIVDQNYAGKGLGRELMTQAIDHCGKTGFSTAYLTTFDGLLAARKLYESFDFKLVEENDIDQWQGGVKEQLFVRKVSQIAC